MTYQEKISRLNKLDKELTATRSKLNKRRAELRKQKLERRKREFDKMPLEERSIFEKLGWSPYQEGKIIYRLGGAFKVK